MALKQGFVTINTDPYIYQENTNNNTVSASIGINSAGTGTFDINLSTSAGAAPGTGFQPLSIDPVTGTITLTPLGGGVVAIAGPLQVSGGITFNTPLTVANGGTGRATATAYAVICGGTTATGAHQSIASVGTSGQVLTSNGAGALPTFQAAAGGGVTSAIATANQVSVSAATGAVTFSIPSTFIAPGSAASTTTLTAGTGFTITTGNATITNGNLLLPTTSATVGQVQINGSNFMHAFGTDNAFVGFNCGNTTLSGATQNTGMGSNALQSIVSGDFNSGFGRYALNLVSTGSLNTGCGDEALSAVTTGSRNTALGYNAGGSHATTDSSNICIGSEAVGVGGQSNRLQVGAGTGTGNGQLNKSFVHGIFGITTAVNDAVAVLVDSAGQLGTVSSSIRYKENVRDMADASTPVLGLRPTLFNFKASPDIERMGLIAEEVLEVMPSLVAYNQEGQVETVKYHELPVLLLNELQKAVTLISDLQARVAALEAK